MPEITDIVLIRIQNNFDDRIITVVDSMEDNSFVSDIYIGTLETGEIVLSPFYDIEDLIPEHFTADLEQITTEICGG